MEVKEIENDKEVESIIKDFDEVLNGFLSNKFLIEFDERYNLFMSFDGYDFIVLMF